MTFVPLSLHFISTNTLHGLSWNVIVLYGLVLPLVTWLCLISYRNGYLGLLGIYILLNLRLIVEIQPVLSHSAGLYLVDVHLKCLKWFYLLQTCHFSRIFQISGLADLQYLILFDEDGDYAELFFCEI